MEKTETTPAKRSIITKRVIGANGRPRTIQMCENGCWHSGYGAAVKCKAALGMVAQGLVHHWEPQGSSLNLLG